MNIQKTTIIGIVSICLYAIRIFKPDAFENIEMDTLLRIIENITYILLIFISFFSAKDEIKIKNF